MAHPDSEQLSRWLRSLPVTEDRRTLRHVLECPTCRQQTLAELQRWDADPEVAEVLRYRLPAAAGGSTAGESPATLPASLHHLSMQAVLRAQAEQRSAQRRFEELTALPPARQQLRVRNDPRFRTPALAQRLLEHSQELSFDEPEAGERTARLALLVIGSADPTVYGPRLIADLEGRAWTHVGNTLRMQEDLDGAEEAFREAERLLEGTADPLEEAGYLHRLATLRRVQRRFGDSLHLLQRAAGLYREVGDRPKLAQVLTSLGNQHIDAGEEELAVEPLLEAHQLVDPAGDPRTALYVLHTLTSALLAAGRVLEAQHTYRTARPLYERFPDRVTQVRRRWLEGQLAAGTGRPDEAEALLLEVRRTYAESGQDDQAAAVSLDLAGVYAEQGRGDDLRRLVGELTQVFRTTPVHRDARAAFALLDRAVRQERTAVEVLARIVRRTAAVLRRSRHDHAG